MSFAHAAKNNRSVVGTTITASGSGLNIIFGTGAFQNQGQNGHLSTQKKDSHKKCSISLGKCKLTLD
jgi:hypothetical protein